MKKYDKYLVKGYLPTIGIECHTQLKTKTKLFAGVSNNAKDAAPNTLISHICLGMPGALPVLNKSAVELAIKAAFALNTEPQIFSKFDRKHYFYPDLPKGYQITQYEEPIILGGFVSIIVDGKMKHINITRAHLEEDAGKSSHPEGSEYSLVDLNRAGTPLLEIVSEPQIHSANEAKLFAKELHQQMRYAEVSDGDLYQGNMRFDVNVSVSKSTNELGVRTETKNLNSFKSVERAVAYEINRQIELLEKGNIVTQETRGWDDAKQKTFSQRSKEEAHDYRYFPEPDIPPIIIDEQTLQTIKQQPRINPQELRRQLQEVGVDKMTVETLIEEYIAGKFMYNILNTMSASAVRRVAHWLAVDVQAWVSDSLSSWGTIYLDENKFANLYKLVESKQISSTAAKTILYEMITKNSNPLDVAKQKDLIQVSDDALLGDIVDDVIKTNPNAVNDIKNGQTKAIAFLIGQVMKQSKGKANPSAVQKIIKQKLN